MTPPHPHQVDRFAAARAVLENAIASRAFPGCAFGVLAGGEILLADSLGRFTYEPSSPAVTPETVYDIASVTKVAATTAMAMLLHQRGSLDLELLLGDVLPGFVAGRQPEDNARKVTLRHLLAHNSGPPAYLGNALEVCCGENLAVFTHREIFTPLAMSSTGFCPASRSRPAIAPTEEDTNFRHRRIQGEVQDENAWVLKGTAGHAGLFSNVPDLLRFSAEILDSKPEKVTPGKPASLFTQQTVQLFAERQGPEGSSRAIGWDTPSQNSSSGIHFSPHSIGHLGFSGCSLWIDLEAGVAIALLTSRTWPDRQNQLIREVRPAFHDAIREAL